jgi:RNase P subunit RPR2
MIEYEEVEELAVVTKIKRIVCDNCECTIPQVPGCPQPEDAVDILFRGGYGQYIDGHSKVLFCKTCADALCVAFPSIKKAMDEATFVF